jgi:4-amino-4-deoxy-L-arabinose transferase-like glycosyltransferase
LPLNLRCTCVRAQTRIDFFSYPCIVKKWPAISVIMLLTLCLGLYGISTAELEAWDEARRGINALRMLQEGDFWNYRFLDIDDTFNTKPPLFTWLVALCFKWFGVSTLSLRLPSLIALLAYTFMVYRFVEQWKSWQVATLTALVLLLSQGIVGFHVALSGDTDMLFIMFLTGGLLLFFSFWQEKKTVDLLGAFIWFALAFLTKGLAVALVVPGLIAFSIVGVYRSGWKQLPVLKGSIVLVFLAALCYLICSQFGLRTEYQNGFGSLWEAMFLQDGITRFSDKAFESGYKWDFLPVALDIGFSPWIYLLYSGALFYLFRGGGRIKSVVRKDDFLLYAIFLIASVSGLLLASQNKHQWYVAPMLLPLAYIVALLLSKVAAWKVWIKPLIITLFVVLLATRLVSFTKVEDAIGIGLADYEEHLNGIDTLSIPPQTRQDLLFHLYLINPEVRIVTNGAKEDRDLDKGDCEGSIEGYCFLLNR